MTGFVLIIVLFSMLAAIFRIVRGPETQDRLLAANVFGTLTVIFVIALSFYRNDMEFIDIAIVYALINFVTTVAVLRYIKYKSFE